MGVMGVLYDGYPVPYTHLTLPTWDLVSVLVDAISFNTKTHIESESVRRRRETERRIM